MRPIVFASGTFPFNAPDRAQGRAQLAIHPASLHDHYQQRKHRSIKATGQLDKSIQKVHLIIDYHLIQAAKPTKPSTEQVLADALTYVRLLTLGRQLHGARSRPKDQTVRMLINMIPTQYFAAAGIPYTSLHLIITGGLIPSHRQILDAAAAYMPELVVKKTASKPQMNRSHDAGVLGPDSQTWSEQTKTVAPAHNEDRQMSDATRDMLAADTRVGIESETPTERALRKMDQWCGLWLNGGSKGDDWDTFKDCLDIPD